MNYRVIWECEVEATSPEEAAREALKIHRDPGSIATIFTVVDILDRRYKVDMLIEPAQARLVFEEEK